MEDLLTQAGRKGCAKMAVLNLSVLPKAIETGLLHEKNVQQPHF
ncbi:hypothetical protein [Selenomonas sp. oral taxon 126]|nr:hypothetical protein [Selenomonas sp. oral taxon 126]